MIIASHKEIIEAIKWSKKNSPVAHLVLSMNGKWGTEKDNPMNVVAAFARLWPETRSFLQTAAMMNYKDGGLLRPSEFDINYPQQKVKIQILRDFFDLLMVIAKYMDEVEDFSFMESFCRDMLKLFVWNTSTRDIFRGTILYSLDKQGKEEEAWSLFAEWKNEKTASFYSLAVLDRIDTVRAAAILDPYRSSENDTLKGYIKMLDRLRVARGEVEKCSD
ncbi:MAG: hypothetical protein II889_07295 [Clostridia bacterium]|nr:hypothetical protein [Clostridia bacterium]